MFEEVISYFLTKYLGDYVSGINKDALNISILSGNVELNNLVYKKYKIECKTRCIKRFKFTN